MVPIVYHVIGASFINAIFTLSLCVLLTCTQIQDQVYKVKAHGGKFGEKYGLHTASKLKNVTFKIGLLLQFFTCIKTLEQPLSCSYLMFIGHCKFMVALKMVRREPGSFIGKHNYADSLAYSCVAVG